MSKEPYHNDASQEDRYAVLVNDKRASTYANFHLPEEDVGGRFRKLEPRTIVGVDNPIPSYGRTAPWSATQLPDEPPLGYEIDAQEPVGTLQEIEASIGNEERPRVAYDDATDFSAVASSEEPAPAPRFPAVGVADGSAPIQAVVEPSVRSNKFKRRI